MIVFRAIMDFGFFFLFAWQTSNYFRDMKTNKDARWHFMWNFLFTLIFVGLLITFK